MISFLLSMLGCKKSMPQPGPPSWSNSKVLAENEDHPSKLLSDGLFVYYVTGRTVASQREGTNNIKQISLKDGSVSVLVKGGELVPNEALAMDNMFLYWSDGGNILRVPKEGGQSEVIVPNAPMPAEMVVDDQNIYWIIWGGEGSPPRPIMFAPKLGGQAKRITPPQSGANGICLDADSVYWISIEGISKVQKTGGEALLWYPNPTPNLGTSGLAQDKENFYFAQMKDRGGATMMKLPKRGGNPVQVAPSVNRTMEFVVDDSYVYYFDNEKGSFSGVVIKKVSKSGGQPVDLDRGSGGWVGFIAIDQTNIYFTNISNVYALAK
jgi:hypothetical protein